MHSHGALLSRFLRNTMAPCCVWHCTSTPGERHSIKSMNRSVIFPQPVYLFAGQTGCELSRGRKRQIDWERERNIGRNFKYFWPNLQRIDKLLHSKHPDPQTAVLSCCIYCAVILLCDLWNGATFFVWILVQLKFDFVSEHVPYTMFLGMMESMSYTCQQM